MKFFSIGFASYLTFLFVVPVQAASTDVRLAEAVRRGDANEVRTLLTQRVDVNTSQPDGATALSWAVHRDDAATAMLLIRAGADVNAANELGVTPLHLACVNGNLETATILLKASANLNTVLVSGETFLMTASRTGNLDVVKLLLASGAQVNAKETRRGQTALMWAVAENHLDVVNALIEYGADVNARSKSGFTALMFAAQQGNLKSIEILLAKGARVNDTTPEDGSALLVATFSGHESLAMFLLDHGADPNLANRYGLAPIHCAILRGLSFAAGVQWDANAQYLYRPNMPELVKVLLAHGANPNARITKVPPLPAVRQLAVVSVNGATPYLLAAASYDVNLMRILIAAGADPHLVTNENTNALIFAAGLVEGLGKTEVRTKAWDHNALETVKLAVELGDDVNTANKHDVTPLHGAAYVGSDAIVQFLVDKGAKLDVKDDSGQTPLSIAQQIFPPTLLDDNLRPGAIHQSTADLLLKLGANPNLVTGDESK